MKRNVKLLFAATLMSSTLNPATAFAETSVSDMANKNGIKTCAGQIKTVADHTIKDRAHGSYATWNKSNPDNRMYDALTVMSYSDGDTHLSITASPNPVGKCDSTYVETFVQKGSCMLARENTFGNWKFSGDLNGSTVVLKNDNGSVDLYLTPALNGSACMITKREMVYQ